MHIPALAKKLLEAILPLDLLEKIARIRELGASDKLIDICLKKAQANITFVDLVTELGSQNVRALYTQLDPKTQHQIEVMITPPSLLAQAPRRHRKESEIWQARHEIHKLKTEILTQENGKGRSRQTWKRVTELLHEKGIIKDKTQQQIYWTLKDKRDSQNLSADDRKLLDDMFVRVERGYLKTQIEGMADIITVARQRHSWKETQKMLEEFADWHGSLAQLMGAYSRLKAKKETEVADQSSGVV